MKTNVITYYRMNTKNLASTLSTLSLSNEIVSVIRTSEFENAGPVEGNWADYVVIYR